MNISIGLFGHSTLQMAIPSPAEEFRCTKTRLDLEEGCRRYHQVVQRTGDPQTIILPNHQINIMGCRALLLMTGSLLTTVTLNCVIDKEKQMIL